MNIDHVKLYIAMSNKKVTISELAEISRVSRNTISCIKHGKSCTPVVAGRLAEALGVDVTELIKNQERS